MIKFSRCVYLSETGELGRSLELVDMIIDRCKVKTNGVIQTNNLLIRLVSGFLLVTEITAIRLSIKITKYIDGRKT